MFRSPPKNVKVISIIIVLLIVVGIGYMVYQQLSNRGKIAVTVSVVPADAKVTVDGNAVHTGTIYLIPDKKYTISVKKEGFSDYSQTQYIDQSRDSIIAALAPASDEAKKWADTNGSAYSEIQTIGGDAASKRGIDFSDRNPITADLPYENLLYTIGYQTDTNDPSGNSIILTIDAMEGYRNAAVQQIRDLGYEPTDFKIIFRDYKNPFSS